MILTDRGNRKPKKEEEKKPYYSSTLEELEARIPKNVHPVGKEAIEYYGCECNIVLDDDVKEGTQEAIWFYENVANHHEDCEYVWWESISL